MTSTHENSSIAIVVLTHNRVHLLRQCVENVLERTSEKTKEIVIWNNGSTDGTREFLDTLEDPRIRVVHSERNIGMNGYDEGFRATSSTHLVDLDDDMIDAPERWDETLLDAFLRLPDVGFLSANLVDNPHDVTSQIMYGRNAHLYRVEQVNGVRLKVGGPVGGGCSMTSRKLYDRLGGFGQDMKRVFWLEDESYLHKVRAAGFQPAYLNDVQILHAGGAYYAPIGAEKQRYWEERGRRIARKNALKQALLRIPFLRPLNERYGWFVPPERL